MSSKQEILSDLIARHEGKLDDAKLTEYARAAETLASLGDKAPSLKSVPPDPAIARATRIAELQAQVGKGTERQRLERAGELGQLLARKHRIGPTDHNGHTLPFVDPEDAA